MQPDDLVKFLKLLRDMSGVNDYWKIRINKTLTDMGANPNWVSTHASNLVEEVGERKMTEILPE